MGEQIDDWLHASVAAGDAKIQTPDGRTESATLTAEPNATRLQFAATDQSGLYRLDLGGAQGSLLFAVNIPANGESDLQRLPYPDLQSLTPDEDVQIVTKLDAVRHVPKRSANESSPAVSAPPLVLVIGSET